MNLFSLRGGARRAQGPARRRAGRFAPSMIEALEGRQLLAAGNFGLNVEISPYASFANLFQEGGWGDVPGQSNAIVLNATGDPESDSTITFDLRVNQPWNGPDPNAVPPPLNGTYNLTFNGEAKVQPEYQGFSTAFTIQNQVYNAATNTTTAQLVVPASNTSDFFGITFLNTQATATSAVNTGFSNASLSRVGSTSSPGQLYSNQFLAALQPYTTLRYLGPSNTNNQPYFNGNTLVTVGASQVDQTGLPWEYLITLANESQTDMWVNVPQGATNDYITAMANIFKNGGTVAGVYYPGLNSNLKVYLEYSNEVWGGIPGNQAYQLAAVQNSATNMPLSTFPGNLDIYNNTDGSTTTNVYTAVGRRYLEETADIGQIFQSVLGSDPTHQRIRPVLGWQENNHQFFPGALSWYQNFFGSVSTAFYGIGDANYVNPTDYTSVNSILSTLQSQFTSYSIPDTTDFTALSTFYGLANVSYEGGPSIGGDGSTSVGQNALAASRAAGMEPLVLQEYDDFYAAGGTLAMYFDGPFATWSPQNEWSAAELAQLGNPTASPKYRGTVDVSQTSPVAVTAGIAVPASGTTFGVADSTGQTLNGAYTGQQVYYLLNAASAGTYDLKLTTGNSGAVTPGQIEVFINDKQVGGIVNVPPRTVIDLGNLALSAGLNSLSIYVVHGNTDPSGTNYQFTPLTFTLATPGTVVVGDNGFEDTPAGVGNVQYAPTNTPWVYSGSAGNGSGVAGNNSSLTSSNPPAPQGSQVAFLQGSSSLIQTLPGWLAGTYAISFDAALSGSGGVQNFDVLVDGLVVATFTPTSMAYQSYTTNPFTVMAGSHVIEFLGLDSARGANTDLLDAVTVATASSDLKNVATGGTASDSGSDNSVNGQGAAQAFDGNTATNWLTFANSAYLQYQFGGGAAYVVSQYAITSGYDTPSYPGRAPKNWTFLGSNDGANWTPLDTQANQADTASLDSKTYSIANTTAYKYYRFNVTANGGGGIIQIAELQLLAPPVPPQLVNVATGGTASDSGSDNSANGQGAAQAFDGNTATNWLTFANSAYVQYQFGGGAAYVVTQYAITSGYDTPSYPGRAPKNWTFLGSNDGANWTPLDTQANQADTASLDTRTYLIANTTAYKYYRYNVTANGGGGIIQIAELQLLAPPVPPQLVNVATGGLASDSGSDNSANGQGAAQAFDGNTATNWLTFANSAYVQYQFGGGAAYVVSQYAITSGYDTPSYPGRAPKNWTFLGSNDGANWTPLDTQANQADTASLDTRTFSIANTTAYKYYRFNVTANGGGGIIQIAEFQLLAAPSSTPNVPTLGDGGFEQVNVGSGNFAYSPTASAWTFNSVANVGGTGISGNNSALTSGNPGAPQGNQVAFIEGVASFSQSVTGWSAGTYSLSFDDAARGNDGTQQEGFEVLIDGTVVGTYLPLTAAYQADTTSTFTVTAGTHTIEFLGVDPGEEDYTALVDNVSIL